MVHYHASITPSVGDYVIACIKEIQETIGYLVTLPEYDDVEAFINMKEVTRQRYKKLKGIVSVGDIQVVEITAVNGNYIDASRKYLDLKKVDERLEEYKNKKKAFDWLQHGCTLKESIKQEYIDAVVRSDNDDIPDHLQELHDQLQTHRRQHSLTDKSQSKDILIPFGHQRVDVLNRHLRHLRDKFNCSVTALTPKNRIYNVTLNRKCQEKDLESILTEIKSEPIDESPIDSPCPSSERESIEEDTVQPIMNIGVIGHVATGKTTLISALTQVDTRRFKKEILTNRTLKLGYTNISITKCSCGSHEVYLSGRSPCQCPCIVASIVDCPGHNVLLSTMISGAHLMDLTLIVVAASEICPQVQTREHVDIVQIIGKIDDHVVVQNKLDLMDQDSAIQHKKQIDDFLESSQMTGTHIVPFSAQKQINTDIILQWLYENAVIRKERKTHPVENAYGIVVRTFDINKPGTREVQGLIIGGGVCQGRFRVAEEIMILPQRIVTKIVSIKSDQTRLDNATSGGLIGIQTDLNPVWADHLVGSTFIHRHRFKPENLHVAGFEMKVKYYLLKDSKSKSLKTGDLVTIHVLAQCIDGIVTGVDGKKYCTIKTNKDFYVHESSEFLILRDKRLIGYGKGLDCNATHIPRPASINIAMPEYTECLRSFYGSLDGLVTFKARLPIPKAVYLNTYTTISNFGEICAKLSSSTQDVGKYVHSELGARSWSINAQHQLILKGRWNENKVMTVLKPFIVYRRCNNCKSMDTSIISDKNVKKLLCKDCKWTEVKRKPV